jgi:hypothetical protein
MGTTVTLPTHEDHRQAKEALEFIRQTMESASSFTAVSGWGLVVVGVVGLAAAAVAARLGEPTALKVWVPAATLAVADAAVANAGKAKRLKVPVWSGAFRKLVWVMAPVLVAGAVLTYALAGQGAQALLPGTWLALYGAGVTAGGTLSVRAIRGMGLLLLTFGAVALLRPELGAPLLAAGFGAAHLGFGMLVITRHGG